MKLFRLGNKKRLRELKRLKKYRRKLRFMNTRVKALEKRVHDLELAMRQGSR